MDNEQRITPTPTGLNIVIMKTAFKTDVNPFNYSTPLGLQIHLSIDHGLHPWLLLLKPFRLPYYYSTRIRIKYYIG